MRRLASRGLFACAMLSLVAACAERATTAPTVAVPASPRFTTLGVGATAPDLLTFGGTGGDSYYDNCPTGSVATGAKGILVRYNGTAAMYDVQLRCRMVGPGGLYGSPMTIAGWGLGLGIDLTQLFDGDCPSGSVIVGAFGRADGIIREFGIKCRSFNGDRTTVGPWTGLGVIPPTTVDYAGECPAGYAVAGIFTHAGYIMDGMSFPCRLITGAAPTAAFASTSTVAEGSTFALSMSNPDAAGDVSLLRYSFDCGSGYGAPGTATTATCPTTDNGNLTVHGRVSTTDGVATEYTRTVVVTNVAPTVAPLTSASLFVGETYTSTGTFTDPGADSWTGVADYEPAISSSVNVAGKTFALSHTYATAGTFTVTVHIADDDGGAGTAATTVTVLSPAQAGSALSGQVNALVTSGDVSAQTAAPLLQSLATATQSFQTGRTIPAQNELNAFKNKVDAALKSGKITSATAASLKSAADRIIASSSL